MNPEARLPFSGHLKELRARLIRCVIALVVTTILSLVFADKIIEFIKQPAGDIHFIFTEVTEMIGVYMRVSLMGGFILAMPYIIGECLMFVSPALTRREKKYVYIVLPWVGMMFLAGVAFGYYVMLPPAIKFLLTFGTDIAVPQIKIGNYISLVTRILIAIGLVFELPVVTTLLARIGVITSHWLAGKRKIAIVVAFIVAAIITPTFDPVNQILVAVPLILLYEMSIWLALLVQKKRTEEEVPAAE